uniref:Ig-like domain-containing protein n=1 Tax=Chelydra serpentina TaxID=8475 RepID=A0A8C3SZ21_CHESE
MEPSAAPAPHPARSAPLCSATGERQLEQGAPGRGPSSRRQTGTGPGSAPRSPAGRLLPPCPVPSGHVPPRPRLIPGAPAPRCPTETLLPPQPPPVVGGGVSLAPEPATQDFTSCSWYRSAITDDNSRILTYYPGPSPVQQNGPTHTGRETAGPGCALHIAGLTLSDTGNYTVRIDSPTSPVPSTTVYLRVSEGVSGVNITMSPSVPIEPEAVTLSCEARGSPVSYSWFKDNEILEAGSRVLLSSDNQTLTLDPSSRNDSGSYTCLATNTVSSQNATVRLDVLYGPNTPSITPRQEVYAEGSTLQLSCRADASPAAVFIWLFNGAPLASSGSDLLVPSLSVSQSGTYTCVVIILFAGRSSYTTLEIAVLGE